MESLVYNSHFLRNPKRGRGGVTGYHNDPHAGRARSRNRIRYSFTNWVLKADKTHERKASKHSPHIAPKLDDCGIAKRNADHTDARGGNRLVSLLKLCALSAGKRHAVAVFFYARCGLKHRLRRACDKHTRCFPADSA